MVCRAELRRMKDVYPEFADQVAFYAIGQDPSESLELMEQYRKQQGYPWPIAKTDPKTLVDLRVLQSSTKIAFDSNGVIAFDSNGVIAYRAVHGGGNSKVWRQVFQEIADSAMQ